MKKKILLIFILLSLSISTLSSLPPEFAEDYYLYYYQRMLDYPVHIQANIVYLERALIRPFRNPLYAICITETKKQYRKYQNLFRMQVNLLILKEYRKLAKKYYLIDARFYHYPVRETHLKGLVTAEEFINLALFYWKEVKKWSDESSKSFFFLTDIQKWEDDNFRIQNGDLDYEFILNRDLEHLKELRDYYESMDENTY